MLMWSDLRTIATSLRHRNGSTCKYIPDREPNTDTYASEVGTVEKTDMLCMYCYRLLRIKHELVTSRQS